MLLILGLSTALQFIVFGAAIIVGSGCYAMLREARLRRTQLRAAGMSPR